MKNPFFSVIVPSYNRSDFLPKAITSVLQQSFSSFELIIIDDGSTDSTYEVVNDFVLQDSRVRYIYQVNSERGAARNTGINSSCGKWISFLDSDDEYMIHHLQLLFEFVSEQTTNSLVVFKYLISDSVNTKESETCRLSEEDIGLNALLKGNPFACNYAISNSAGPIFPFLESRLLSSMEDWIFLIQNVPTHGLSLMPRPSVILLDHFGRSMNANQSVIRARLCAINFLCSNTCDLSLSQLKTLTAYSYLFCAIHSYLDNKRYDSLGFFVKSTRYRIKLAFKLDYILKFLLGRKLIVLILSFLESQNFGFKKIASI